MNFKLFFRFMSVAVLIQSVAFAAYSATTPALRSFRGARFQAPVTSTSSLNREPGWSSRLEYMMNPQANPYNPQAQIPRATLKPEVVKSIANRPVSEPTSWVSMNSSAMPYQNYNYMALFTPAQNFVQNLVTELDELDAMYAAIDLLESEEYHLKRRALLAEKLEGLNFLNDQLDPNDIKGQLTILNMQDFLQASLDYENSILEDLPAIKRRAQIRQFEKQVRQNRLNSQAAELDKELGRGMSVENPYEQVKQDFKNQFTRGAKIGAVGAGTAYGLSKYKKANNQ